MTQSTNRAETENRESLLLPGLDGANPLGFLAALGVLRTLSLHNASITLHWTPANGTWCAALSAADAQLSKDDVLERLEAVLPAPDEDLCERILKDLGKLPDNSRHSHFGGKANAATQMDRVYVDLLAAFSSDCVPADAINQIQTVRRDYFLKNVESIVARTDRYHLERSLFQTWDYADSLENQSLHLDPSEDRRHAYQWNQPSGDPNRKKQGGMLGANRLAIEAIPLLVSVPINDRLNTLGFSGLKMGTVRWTWPIWTIPATRHLVSSLLTISVIQQDEIRPHDVLKLHEMGVSAVFRSELILVQQTKNFSPSRCIA
ncbi:type I-G CRISPR-associated protein, Cas3-extension family [Gimesia panareensis]|uniref:type I-G CRISPR-associated protein, Cas3-extension family n=1 Tax=Gimesia panareensis TaxID=2527978 RepID=UPI00118A407C|nr:hypothetical protein [Gimesia panareensis]QDU47877.1 hypothetical protein Pan110_01870 [Gimesia panareensis]